MSEYRLKTNSKMCRAARAWLGWSQQGLASSAAIAINTVREFEAGRRRIHPDNMKAVVTAFGNSGIAFVWEEHRPIAIWAVTPAEWQSILAYPKVFHEGPVDAA
jgi:hypothetical protein